MVQTPTQVPFVNVFKNSVPLYINEFFLFLTVLTRETHLRMLTSNREQQDYYMLVTTEHRGSGIKCGLGVMQGECSQDRMKLKKTKMNVPGRICCITCSAYYDSYRLYGFTSFALFCMYLSGVFGPTLKTIVHQNDASECTSIGTRYLLL